MCVLKRERRQGRQPATDCSVLLDGSTLSMNLLRFRFYGDSLVSISGDMFFSSKSVLTLREAMFARLKALEELSRTISSRLWDSMLFKIFSADLANGVL